MIEKTMRMSNLFDFYGSLLTSKQRDYMQLYYFDDYSLGEIAEQFDVSRQAVYDTLRRTETMLEEFEEKLALLTKFQRRSELLDELKQLAPQNGKVLALVDSLESLD
ncbi:MAG TPA: putative DNA-binding protein [Bacillales bacterium]|nr:putative DNA-binding protein [Bacillales bacterium]